MQRKYVEQGILMRTAKEEEVEKSVEELSMTGAREEFLYATGFESICLGLFFLGLGVVFYNVEDFGPDAAFYSFLMGLAAFSEHPRSPWLLDLLGGLSIVAIFFKVVFTVISFVAGLLFCGLSAMWNDLPHMIGM